MWPRSVRSLTLLALFFALWCAGCSKHNPTVDANAPSGDKSGDTSAVASEEKAGASLATSAQPDREAKLETAILAGGCFWGMEDILRRIPGVIEIDAGYTGGTTPNPTYEDVHTGETGHAEAVRVVFDPSKLSYEDLLRKWFFRMHDPTTENRQGNDIGSQYRSAIFYTTPAQRETAVKVKQLVDKSGEWDDPVVTQIVPASTFTLAEGYHQDYLEKHPGGYTCHFLRDMTF